MKRKWKVLTPLAVSAAAAIAAGLTVLLQKTRQDGDAEEASPAPAAPAGELRTGTYSFISGFRDAAKVELSLDYDPEKYSFRVVEEDFLCYTGDSHVALVCGEDFSLQIEYAGYYAGENYSAHCKALSEKYQGFGTVIYGGLDGVRFRNGDNVCLCFPIEGDEYSCLLVTVIKNPGYDGEVDELPDHPELAAMLSSLRFSRG